MAEQPLSDAHPTNRDPVRQTNRCGFRIVRPVHTQCWRIHRIRLKKPFAETRWRLSIPNAATLIVNRHLTNRPGTALFLPAVRFGEGV